MIKWILYLIFSLFNVMFVFASPAKHLCRPDQRDALWEFQSDFYFDEYKTKWWSNNTDCCSWDGVSCDPTTGKVVQLNLFDTNLQGILPDSITNLKYLDTLSLSGCNLFGKIPSSLGNLSYLTYLDLSGNNFAGELPDTMGSLIQLRDLLLHNNKLSGNFPLMLLNLSGLTEVNLASNQFQGMLPSNMSGLSGMNFFEIGENSFSGSVPLSLFMIPSLTVLSLRRNSFSGPLGIENISSSSKLSYLSLGVNNFSGPIPRSILNLVRLEVLDLSFWNTGRGMVDFSIFLHFKSLASLYLSYLNTRSIVDLSHFSHLTSLRELDLSGNNLKFSSTLHLPSSLSGVSLSSCNISEFPKFLQTQTNLNNLDISANQIEGQVPEWLWRLPRLQSVNISQNSFSGFEGSADVIQRSALYLYMLDISYTFQDPFPLLPNFTRFLFGSDNLFSGEIPRTICEMLALDTLVLSNNNFSGSIPRCFNNFNTSLSILHLQNNSLSGVIPKETISDRLRSLDVGHNQLSGELPKSLINCTDLEFLNVENNRINDKFPFWLRLLPNLQIIVLRSNEFFGPISAPGVSLSFPMLRIFDISKNRFTGILPSDYFAGWSAMSYETHIGYHVLIDFGGRDLEYHNSVALTNKGLNMELVGSGFRIYKTIDVSENRLEGDIPESISLLKELIVLN
ncbi:hypothetical protein EUTSA_v10026889mg, partial [Eutrema salsugineum]